MSDQASPRILLVAGEASGDLLGAQLAAALKQRYPNCYLFGVGGHHMRAAGVDIIASSDELAVVGAIEILRNLRVIYRTMRMLVNQLKTNPPDLLIPIDYPGFNLRLSAKAKALGIKVMYYVSPQIWAWRYHRINKIRKSVDLMAVLFPFEKKIYEKEGVPVEFVGHPLAQAIQPSLSKQEAYQHFHLSPQFPCIALLPGSRLHEVERMLPTLLAAVRIIRKKLPQAQFVLPLAGNLSPRCLDKFNLSRVHIVHNNLHNVLQICDAAVATSGTVTLEVALLQVPLLVVYKFSRLSYAIGKLIMRRMTFGLCNIVAEEKIALELLQHEVTPQAIGKEVLRLINDIEYRNTIKQKLARLAPKLASKQSAQQAANAAAQLITNSAQILSRRGT